MTISTQAESGPTIFEQLDSRFTNIGQACRLVSVTINGDVHLPDGEPVVQAGDVIGVHEEPSANIEVIHGGVANVWDLRRVE